MSVWEVPSFWEHSFAQRRDHRYEWVMFVDWWDEARGGRWAIKNVSEICCRDSFCSLAPPFIWLVQLWAQGLIWMQGPISLDFCPLVSSLLLESSGHLWAHAHWPLQELPAQGARDAFCKWLDEISHLLLQSTISPSFYYWIGVLWGLSIGD